MQVGIRSPPHLTSVGAGCLEPFLIAAIHEKGDLESLRGERVTQESWGDDNMGTMILCLEAWWIYDLSDRIIVQVETTQNTSE